MEFTITEHKGYKRCDYVKARGYIDAHTASVLEEKFNEILAAGRSGIAFDMEDVDYICSRFLRVLVRTQKACERAKGKLVLVNINEQVKGPILEISGIQFFIEIYDDLVDAIGSF